jgi:hypothetical protein
MDTVLFDSRASFLERQSLMHLYFQHNPDRDVRPVSVFHDYVSYNKYRHLDNTELLSTYWDLGHIRYTKAMLQKIEEKYNLLNFWNIVASDRFIKNWKENEVIKQISFYIYAWESILDKYKPVYVVSETVTGLWNYILFLICKQKDIKYLSIHTTKNTGRYYYSTDQFGSWVELEQRYKELLKRGLKQNEIDIALEFVRSFNEKQLVPPYMRSTATLPNYIKFINFPRFFINFKKDIVQNWIFKNHDYKVGYRLSEYGYTLTRSKRIIYSRLMNLFEKPDLNKQYILYPVHFQPEASTDIWAPYYSDQIFIIRAIARSLPFGFYLYVKEHTTVLGSKPIKFYKEINKIPNVKLIDPFVRISDLVSHSQAVIVLTGTSGLESILWNKPTIVFGEVFYSLYPFINRVYNLNDLPGIIKNAIRQEIRENCSERLAFIYLYSIMGYKSNIYTYQPSDNEVICFIDELLEEITKR